MTCQGNEPCKQSWKSNETASVIFSYILIALPCSESRENMNITFGFYWIFVHGSLSHATCWNLQDGCKGVKQLFWVFSVFLPTTLFFNDWEAKISAVQCNDPGKVFMHVEVCHQKMVSEVISKLTFSGWALGGHAPRPPSCCVLIHALVIRPFQIWWLRP